jgi:hypothetical protein
MTGKIPSIADAAAAAAAAAASAAAAGAAEGAKGRSTAGVEQTRGRLEVLWGFSSVFSLGEWSHDLSSFLVIH